MTYLLCHGFGFSDDYWENLIPFLDDKYEFFDKHFKINTKKNYIGIGHSVGFLKLNNSGIKFDALIGLQGFLNFCGTVPAQRELLQKNLDRMISFFSKDTESSLKFFYKACGYEKEIPEKFSKDDLITDLQMMKLSFEHCGAPTLIIGSNEDKIVEKSILEDNFKNRFQLEFINGVNHTLGFSQPKEVFELIKKFLEK